jgi:hypothetical protein
MGAASLDTACTALTIVLRGEGRYISMVQNDTTEKETKTRGLAA